MSENYIVARVGQYTRSAARAIQNHNDRKRQSYKNPDIIPERSEMNQHLVGQDKKSYTAIFDKMVDDKQISTSGLKADAVIFNEILHDVNSEYWLSYEQHGYSSPEEFATAYFKTCLEFDQKKFGTDKVISAVIHYDEINRPLTEKYGFPVYHYHMHVIAIPTVIKEKKWTKRCKDPKLIGTVKERIIQVSDSKFWAWKAGDEKSYAKFQNEIYEHLHPQYPDLLRGESNQKAKHLDQDTFKAAKDEIRKLENEIAELKAENQTLQRDNEWLYQKKKDKAGEVHQLEQDKKALKSEINELERIIIGQVQQMEEKLNQIIETPAVIPEIPVPNERMNFIYWCLEHLKGVLEAVEKFCKQEYQKFQKDRQNEKLRAAEALKSEAGSLKDKLAAAKVLSENSNPASTFKGDRSAKKEEFERD